MLQIACLKVLNGKAVFAGRSSFKTWFFSVIRNTAAGQRRSEFLRSFGLSGLRPPDSSPSGEDLAMRNEKAARLREVMKALPERQREVLQLVFYHDLSIAEAAEVMDVGIGTARTHYERAKEQMRRMLL